MDEALNPENWIEKESETPEKFVQESKQFIHDLDIRASLVTKRTFLVIEKMLFDFRLPIVGEQLRLRYQQQVNLIAVVLFIVSKHDVIDELTITTYTLNKKTFDVIEELIRKGKIKKLNLFVASSYSFRDKKHYEFLKSQCLRLKDFAVHLVFAWIHLKITLAKCGDNFYQFEGSMNYSLNNMAEQLLIENCQAVYDYDYDFLHKIMIDNEAKATEIIC